MCVPVNDATKNPNLGGGEAIQSGPNGSLGAAAAPVAAWGRGATWGWYGGIMAAGWPMSWTGYMVVGPTGLAL